MEAGQARSAAGLAAPCLLVTCGPHLQFVQSSRQDSIDSPMSAPANSVTMSSERRKLAIPEWLPFVIVGLVWLPALLRFSAEWNFNPQYYYGWSVPLLAAYLIYDRWMERPALREPGIEWPVLLSIVLVALPQLPLRLIGEANSTARPISLLMAVVALTISLGILYLYGGRKWMIFFASPVAFLLVSVPWLDQIERPLVQGLMQINAEIAAGLVSLGGIPAEARGNVIEVPTGVLGVNEACSGIRSLQSTLMAAVFLGLLYRRGAIGVAALVALGSIIAFVCNVIRTTFLTYQGAVNGIGAVDEWHDSAGFAILGVVLVFLWLISMALDRAEIRQRAADS